MDTERFVRWLQDQLRSQGIVNAEIILDWNAFAPDRLPVVTIKFPDGSVLKGHPTPMPPTSNQFFTTGMGANDLFGFTPEVVIPYGVENMGMEIEAIHLPPLPTEDAKKLESITREIMEALWGGSPVNARDFGAVGDGKTDDTAAIQRALDAAKSVKTRLEADETPAKLTEKEEKRLSFERWMAENGFFESDLNPKETFSIADVLKEFEDE